MCSKNGTSVYLIFFSLLKLSLNFLITFNSFYFTANRQIFTVNVQTHLYITILLRISEHISHTIAGRVVVVSKTFSNFAGKVTEHRFEFTEVFRIHPYKMRFYHTVPIVLSAKLKYFQFQNNFVCKRRF